MTAKRIGASGKRRRRPAKKKPLEEGKSREAIAADLASAATKAAAASELADLADDGEGILTAEAASRISRELEGELDDIVDAQAAERTGEAAAKKKKDTGPNIFDLVERKLKGRITVEGAGQRRKKRIAEQVVAEVYVAHLVAGHYKWVRDYLDRKMGKPTQRVEVGATALDELRDWIATPAPDTPIPDLSELMTPPGPREVEVDLGAIEELAVSARRLRSKRGRKLRTILESLLEYQDELAKIGG